MKPDNRPKVKLINQDGNAFAILGRCRSAARKAGWTDEQWDTFRKKATAGDYDELLSIVMEEFDVE